MGEGINVEHIVAQIRSRIAARATKRTNEILTSDHPEDDVRRLQVAIHEDAARFAELDSCLQKSTRRIGAPPPVPPTYRGRIGSFAIAWLRKLLWWYALPIHETVDHIYVRNREQAGRHRQFQEQFLSHTEQLGNAMSRIRALEQLSSGISDLQFELSNFRKDIRLVEERASERIRGTSQENARLSQQLGALVDEVSKIRERLENDANQSSPATWHDRFGRCESAIQRIDAQIQGLADLQRRVTNCGLAIEKQRNALFICEQRLSIFLRELRSQLPKPLSTQQLECIANQTEDGIAEVYTEFENIFRGSREEIKDRQRIYVARIAEAGAGTRASPVLDLGSGRGEWLELLSENRFEATGVDCNSGMVDCCRKRGLNVLQADLLSHLAGLPEDSVGAVTSFHVIEHLPFHSVIELIDQSLRVVKPGGLLILETPNPQNALVGSQTFWIDPTHIRPIPSQTLRFFVEARGFCDVEVLPLQPLPDTFRIPEDGSELVRRFNEYFYGPQDYGVIGRRP